MILPAVRLNINAVLLYTRFFIYAEVRSVLPAGVAIRLRWSLIIAPVKRTCLYRKVINIYKLWTEERRGAYRRQLATFDLALLFPYWVSP